MSDVSISCGTPACCPDGCRVSSTFLYSGNLAAASRVTFRPGATSTTGGTWLCLGMRNARCCRKNCVTGAFEERGGELISK
ncbi:hypothetical protein BDR03DRAFT_973851 [Suillus americanus]|nr:hypothetical protein BDR03DRAFT_973851 [Suillus americanus]